MKQTRNSKNNAGFPACCILCRCSLYHNYKFYATEKSMFSYVLTFIELLFMFVFMLILPPFWAGR